MKMKTVLKSLELLLYEYKIFIPYGPSFDGYITLHSQTDSEGRIVVKLRHFHLGAHIDDKVQ